MLFEWIRRADRDFEKEIEKYLFAEDDDILSIEEKSE